MRIHADRQPSKGKRPSQSEPEQVGLPGDDQVAVAVETFEMLGDETRLKILWILIHGERSVGDLAEAVGAQPAAVSQHLAKLRLARLVRQRRDGNRIFYEADDAHVGPLLREALYHADHVAQNLSDHP